MIYVFSYHKSTSPWDSRGIMNYIKVLLLWAVYIYIHRTKMKQKEKEKSKDKKKKEIEEEV